MNWELTIAFVSVLAAIAGTWTTLWFRAGGQTEKLSGLDKDLGELRQESRDAIQKWDSTAKRLHGRIDEVLQNVGVVDKRVEGLPCEAHRTREDALDARIERLERLRNGI